MNERKPKLLLIIPTLGSGGAQRAITRLSIGLEKYFQVFICRFNTRVDVVYPYAGQLLSLDDFEGNTVWTKVRGLLFRVRKLRMLKRKYAIDVSVSFLEGANYINVLSRAGDRVVISLRGSVLHDSEIDGFTGWVRKHIFMRFIYRFADAIVTLSEGLKNEVVHQLGAAGQKTFTIYNHYDPEELRTLAAQPVPEDFARLSQTPLIVMSGRLHPQKGHKAFMNVFARLLETERCKLVIFGDGVVRDKLVAHARELGLKTYCAWLEGDFTDNFDVYFMGFVRDPFRYISKCTVFAFPSLYEGLGNSLVEALACNLPLVATDCHSGPREVLAPGTTGDYSLRQAEFARHGILMPVITNMHAENTWIETLRNLLHDQALRERYARDGAARLDDFSIERIMAQWVEVLK